MYKELKYLIGGSSVIIIALVGMMFFSPLSSQFTDDSVSRGSSWEMDVDELINTHQTDRALNFVDSLIEVKSQDCLALPILIGIYRKMSGWMLQLRELIFMSCNGNE